MSVPSLTLRYAAPTLGWRTPLYAQSCRLAANIRSGEPARSGCAIDRRGQPRRVGDDPAGHRRRRHPTWPCPKAITSGLARARARSNRAARAMPHHIESRSSGYAAAARAASCGLASRGWWRAASPAPQRARPARPYRRSAAQRHRRRDDCRRHRRSDPRHHFETDHQMIAALGFERHADRRAGGERLRIGPAQMIGVGRARLHRCGLRSAADRRAEARRAPGRSRHPAAGTAGSAR